MKNELILINEFFSLLNHQKKYLKKWYQKNNKGKNKGKLLLIYKRV